MIAASETSRDFLNPIMANFGLVFVDGIIVKEQEDNSPEFMACDFASGSENICTSFQYLKNLGYKITTNRSVPIAQSSDQGFRFVPIFCSDSTGCWIEKQTKDFVNETPVFEPDRGDIQWNSQPLMLGAIRNVGDRLQKIIILGNADCVSNSELGTSRRGMLTANFNLVMDTARWFAEGRYPIDVSRPSGKDNDIKINYDTLGLHKAILMWLIPILLIALGSFICIRRYRQ